MTRSGQIEISCFSCGVSFKITLTLTLRQPCFNLPNHHRVQPIDGGDKTDLIWLLLFYLTTDDSSPLIKPLNVQYMNIRKTQYNYCSFFIHIHSITPNYICTGPLDITPLLQLFKFLPQVIWRKWQFSEQHRQKIVPTGSLSSVLKTLLKVTTGGKCGYM